MADSPSEIVAEVMRRVLAPAATSGALRVGRPFGRAGALAAAEAIGGKGAGAGTGEDEVRALLHAGALDATEEAVLRRARAIASVDVAALGPRVDASVVRLAALFHDAIAAFHPDLPGVFRAEAPRRLLDATAHALGEVPAPGSVREALLRHAWLGVLPDYELVKTEVRFWVGARAFVGKEPPSRLLAWPELRRVRRTDRSATILRLPELFGGAPELADGFSRAMACFFAATPLTDLAAAAREVPAFVATPAIEALVATRAGARLARRVVVAAGRSVAAAVAAGAPTVAQQIEISTPG